MDVDPQDKQLSDLHVDLAPGEVDAARLGDLRRERGRVRDGLGHQVFEEGCFHGLCEGVRDGELDHVISGVTERDEVVVYPGLVLAGVVEVEMFDLRVFRAEDGGCEFGDVGEKAGLVRGRHAPYDDRAVVEKEDFWRVDCGVEIRRLCIVR